MTWQLHMSLLKEVDNSEATSDFWEAYEFCYEGMYVQVYRNRVSTLYAPCLATL